MKIKYILTLLGVAAAIPGFGRSLTPAEALQRVETVETRKAKANGEAPELQSVIRDKTGEAALYIFTYSGSDGFMLVSADDAVQPLLGYSEHNSFALDGMPASLDSWLTLYTDQISEARGGQPYVYIKTRAEERPAISPFLKTTWDQGAPFNNLCPVQNNRRCVTGCGATAMAQIMKYWQYPVSGKGVVAYTPSTLNEELRLDLSAITFDWDRMLDDYHKNYSSAEAKAVATLMQACGYSIKMRYTPFESGAYSKDIATALATNFGYDQGINLRLRSSYSTQDAWNDMVYNELATTGPVIYDGQSSSGAHCFVCDGYDGNGFFHINWGWGGMSDGYFVLNELTPAEIGTGGHYGGYNVNQDIIAGIMPPVGRLTLENITVDNAAADSGNVKGWGYTYRINDFSNILISVNLTIAGGHISSPLYYTVYDTDPETKKNLSVVLESPFDESLNASDGKVTCSTYVHLNNYDVSKLYTLNVSYDLKGQRTTIGSIRMAASSGVDDVMADCAYLTLARSGNAVAATSPEEVTLTVYDLSGRILGRVTRINPEIELSGFGSGVYIAEAVGATGERKTIKLHLP